MATLKELNIKITSLKQTKKITSAMKLIATTRFNKMLGVMHKSRTYVTALNALYTHIENSGELLDLERAATTHESTAALQFIVFTSDRGLCGSFNNAVIKAFGKILHAHKGQDCYVDFIGNRGYDYFKNSPHIKEARILTGFTKTVSFTELRPYADEYITHFQKGTRSRVLGVYNAFISTISQKPQMTCLLPFGEADDHEPNGTNQTNNKNAPATTNTSHAPESQATAEKSPPTSSASANENVSRNQTQGSSYFVFEPDIQTLVTQYIQEMVRFNLYQLLVQSVTGEHAARMTAMDNATRNCDDLIDSFTLERNRVRQAAITTELTEIISGAEAATG